MYWMLCSGATLSSTLYEMSASENYEKMSKSFKNPVVILQKEVP